MCCVYLSGVHISTGLKGGRGVLGQGITGPLGRGLKYEVIRARFDGGAEGLGVGLRRSLGRRVWGTVRLLSAIGATQDASGRLFGVGGSGGTRMGTSGGAAGGGGVGRVDGDRRIDQGWEGYRRGRKHRGKVGGGYWGRGIIREVAEIVLQTFLNLHGKGI